MTRFLGAAQSGRGCGDGAVQLRPVRIEAFRTSSAASRSPSRKEISRRLSPTKCVPQRSCSGHLGQNGEVIATFGVETTCTGRGLSRATTCRPARRGRRRDARVGGAAPRRAPPPGRSRAAGRGCRALRRSKLHVPRRLAIARSVFAWKRLEITDEALPHSVFSNCRLDRPELRARRLSLALDL